jgi:hypothetical protein
MTKANGIAMIQELLAANGQEDGTDPDERKQLEAIEEDLGVKPASLEPGSNWGTLILDAGWACGSACTVTRLSGRSECVVDALLEDRAHLRWLLQQPLR